MYQDLEKLKKQIVKSLDLEIGEDNSIKENYSNVIPKSLYFKDKQFVLRNNMNLYKNLVLNLNDKYFSYSFYTLQKHITNVISSKISIIIPMILEYWKDSNFNGTKNQELTRLLDNLNELYDNCLDNIVNENISNKWLDVIELANKYKSYEILINLQLHSCFIKTLDEKIIKNYRKNEKGFDYVFRQNYIEVIFPFYKLLTDSKDYKILGITFEQKEIKVLILILRYIFKDIDNKNPLIYIDKEKYETKDRCYCILPNDLLKNEDVILLKTFKSLAILINNILEIDDFGIYNSKDKLFNINFTDEELAFYSYHNYIVYSSNDERKEVMNEIKKRNQYDINFLNKELNQKNILDNVFLPNKNNNFSLKCKKVENEFTSNLNRRLNLQNFNEPILDPIIVEEFDDYVPLKERLRHTYLLSGSGGGKTSLLEYLFYQDIQNSQCSKIFFDIQGKTTKRIMQFVDKKDLLLINLSLKDNFSLIINPFDWGNKKVEDITEYDIESRTKAILNAFKIALAINWSINMEAVLVPCISTLLRKGYSDIFELQKFMNDDDNQELVLLGTKSPIRGHKTFFENQFYQEKLAVTKDAIATKLQTFLNDRTFTNSVIGKSTIDLKKEINTKGKVIIFQLPKDSILFIRLMIEMIQEIAKKRVADFTENEIIDTHVYFDEFQNYLTPTIEEILAESRNFKLYVTFAHQTMKQLDNKLQDMVLSNTNIKFVSQNSYHNLSTMSKEIQVDIKQLEALEQGEFFLKIRAKEAIKIKTTDKFINMEIDEEKHLEHIEYQLEHYYIKIENENIVKSIVDDSKPLVPTKLF